MKITRRPPVAPCLSPRLRRRGFTLMELLVAIGISVLILAGIAAFLKLAGASLSSTATQTFINYRTSSASEFLFSKIRFATAVSAGGDASGKTLRIGIDENYAVDSVKDDDKIPYNDADHYEIFQFQNGDGNDSTVADNRLIHKTNELSNAYTVLISTGVRALPGKKIFLVDTQTFLVQVNFAVVDAYARDGYQACDIQGALIPRNRTPTSTVHTGP